jgi:hypothetical protein
MDYPTLESSGGEILYETASSHEEILPVGRESEDAEAGPFAGDLLVNESGRRQALAALQEVDPAIRDLRGNEDALSIDYSRTARLLGIIATPYTTTVTVDRDGGVSVSEPWWLALAKRDYLEFDNGDEQQQSRALQLLSNLGKAPGDDRNPYINNTRGSG